MKKIGKKLLFVTGISALMALSSCESKEKREEREDQQYRDSVAAVRAAEKQEEQLTTVIYDSLMNVPNTVSDMSAKQAGVFCNDFKYGRGMGTRQELDSLENVSMANVLHQRVISSAKPIAEKHLKELYSSLATYRLGIDPDTRIKKMLSGEPFEEGVHYGCFLDFYGQEAGDTVYGFSSDDFIDNQNYFVNDVLYGADTAQYGAKRRAEIVQIIEKQYAKMMSALKANRIAVAKQFADYYPVLDLDRVPKQYRKYFDTYEPAMQRAEGDAWYSYGEYNVIPTSFAIVKYVDVYDSKLKPEFFNVPGAKYKLVRVSKGKWQVVRTLKGKIDKTPVFDHNVDYKTEMCYWGVEDAKSGDNSFDASAGANMGVHISVKEYEYVAHATKLDKVPDPNGERADRIEFLEQKKSEVAALDSIQEEYSNRAYETAKEMAKRRLGHNR